MSRGRCIYKRATKNSVNYIKLTDELRLLDWERFCDSLFVVRLLGSCKSERYLSFQWITLTQMIMQMSTLTVFFFDSRSFMPWTSAWEYLWTWQMDMLLCFVFVMKYQGKNLNIEMIQKSKMIVMRFCEEKSLRLCLKIFTELAKALIQW